MQPLKPHQVPNRQTLHLGSCVSVQGTPDEMLDTLMHQRPPAQRPAMEEWLRRAMLNRSPSGSAP